MGSERETEELRKALDSGLSDWMGVSSHETKREVHEEGKMGIMILGRIV